MILTGGISTRAQLFSNLEVFGNRLDVGDPEIIATNSVDGPKGIATADFNRDERPDLAVANTDGTITLYYGADNIQFSDPVHLQTGIQELRGILAADLTGDDYADLIAAAPYAGRVFLFINEAGTFGEPIDLTAWGGARNLAAGDFDGDGTNDLVIAGTTNGLRQLRSLGEGNFQIVANLTSLSATNIDFPKPLYVLEPFRPAGAARDELAVTHADSDRAWILAPNVEGMLEIRGAITNLDAHAMVIGSVTKQTSEGILDLVVASRDFGTIEVHEGNTTDERFHQRIAQRVRVPGGPRALQLADLDNDGWNDLIVVLRNFDRVITYKNSNGVLMASTEFPVGKSPREMVTADFNQDNRPDAAVMNRRSMDVSVLITYPGETGFGGLDQVYPVDGEVSGLAVFDFNKDGRGDVIQLHRASAEISVRLAGEGGLLGPPTFYPMGSLPSAQATVDVNNDDIPDMVTANLGQSGIEHGSVSVRLGDGEGGFGEEQRYYLPSDTGGSLFALVAADFDNDDNIDLAAGFFDCRIAFFKGHGDGSFTFTRSHMFVYESRVMAIGDFDQDGDTDLAGAGYAGDVVVIENEGDLLTTEVLKRYDYPSPTSKKFGTRDIVVTDVNGDGDLDFLVGSGDGTMMFLGLDGMEFVRASDALPGTEFPVSGVTLGDFDGDGSRDVAVSCQILSCITILTRVGDQGYQPALTVDVPSGNYLASGDLDGDGFDDLVGTGEVLWTALSSRRAETTPPPVLQADRPGIPSPVINELLAVNNDLPLAQDGDRKSDWVEIFNGSEAAGFLGGWRIRLEAVDENGESNTQEFVFPLTAFLPGKAHLLLVFEEELRSFYHTGFRLPGGGGVLSLMNPDGAVINRIEYPPQLPNVSYGRYRDGLPALGFNPYPSPGQENADNGSVEPKVSLEDINFDVLQPDQPIRFYARGRDDLGIIGLSLVWQRLDVDDGETHRMLLYDDGMNEDEGMLDGFFSGLMTPGLPEGASIQFYLEAVDLSGQTTIEPDDPVFSRRGDAVTLYTLSLTPSEQRPRLEISEVLASNLTGIQDEDGTTPDWLEIRNCSDQAVSLNSLTLAKTFFGNRSRYGFVSGDQLQPGEHRIVFCDSRPERGSRHAPFNLNREGDRLVLTATGSDGGRFRIDEVAYGPQQEDVAWARLGCAGPWLSNVPTPESANVAGPWLGTILHDTGEFLLAYPTETNRIYQVDHADSLINPIWTTLPVVTGDGIEKTVVQPLSSQRYYRIRSESQNP